jgi:hypothetical protein
MASTAALAQGETRIYQNGHGIGIELRQSPQAGYLIHGRMDGVTDSALCSQHNTETAALAAWRTLLREHATPTSTATVALPLGVTITLTSEQVAGVWRHLLTSEQGARVDEWTRAYGDRAEAVEALQRTAAAFRRFGTAEAIEKHAAALRVENRNLLMVQGRRFTFDERARMTAISHELDQINDLSTSTLLAAVA